MLYKEKKLCVVIIFLDTDVVTLVAVITIVTPQFAQ